jgi:RHS repeat-associated protein
MNPMTATRRVIIFLFVVILTVSLQSFAQSAYPNGYSYRRAIVIDHSKVINTDQVDFPTLISGTYSDLATASNGGRVRNASGFDIIFTSDSAGQTRLDHEIESYDAATGKFNIWVRIPALSHSTDTLLYMWYGNSSVLTSQANVAGVWSNAFRSVYHLSDNAANTAVLDSLGLSNAIASTNTSLASTPGEIARALGTSAMAITASNTSQLVGGAAPRTMSCWAKATTSASDQFFCGYGIANNGKAFSLFESSGSHTFQFVGYYADVNSGVDIADGNWHLLTVSYDGSTIRTYVDGSAKGTGPLTLNTTTSSFLLGKAAWSGNCSACSVDEVRLQGVARSGDWIATEFQNQSSPTSFSAISSSIAPGNSPKLDSITPNAVTIGMTVTIRGVGFGDTQGTSSLTFNGLTASPSNWSDGEVVVPVPVGATSGNVVITVNGNASNTIPVTVYQGYQNGFQNRRAITIDHSKVSNTDQADFPLLVSGTYSDLATVGNGGRLLNPNGYDIVFTSDAAGQNRLDYEVDTLDLATGKCNFWVRVPVLSHSVDTTIHMWYGNPNVATSQENKSSVWSSSHYVTTYHLGTTNALSLNDSSGGGNTLSNSAGVTADVGAVGGAAVVTTNNHLFRTNPAQVPIGSGARTLETWFKFSTIPTWDVELAGYGANSANADRWGVFYPASSRLLCIETQGYSSCAPWAPDTAWHSVAIELPVGCSTMSCYNLFLDGTQQVLSTGTPTTSTNTWSTEVRLNGIPTYNGYRFNGLLDEFRISNDAKSADWIATEYNNQSAVATFITVSSGISTGNSPVIDTVTPNSGSVGSSIIVRGIGFGVSQGTGTISFNGIAATPSSWSDAQIVVPVPAGATTGPVQVVANGASSNSLPFTVYKAFSNGYEYRHILTIDHTKVPNSDQTDLPVLVSGTFPDLANIANGGKVRSIGGFDIIFTSDPAGQNRLDHEIDSYDALTGRVNFWVRVPLLSHAADTILYLWNGNGSVASSLENRAGVWRNGYAAVYHLGSDTVSAIDATGQATGYMNGVTGGAGISGGAAVTSGATTSYIRVPSSSSIKPASALTVEAWAKPNATNMWAKILCLDYHANGSWYAPYASYSLGIDNTSHYQFLTTTSGTLKGVVTNTGVSLGNWQHLAGTYDGSILKAYVNGVPQTNTAAASGAIDYGTSKDLNLGVESVYANINENFIGTFDEVRISSVARSADWIATEYNNQSSPQAFSSISSGLTIDSAPVLDSLTPNSGSVGTVVTIRGAGFGATQADGTVTFNGVSATPASWSDSQIVVTVPGGATTGTVVVTSSGLPSNALPFSIYDAFANGYQYRRVAVIDHTRVANTDQTDFPVLISGTYPDMATISNGGKVRNPNGYDIIFTADAAGQTHLDHEIDSYDPATGKVSFWVRIPSLSHTSDTVIYQFYGNSSVTASQQNKSSLWGAAHYVTAYHLGTPVSLSLADSTSSGNDLSNFGGVGAGSGIIGGAASVAPSNYLYRTSPAQVPVGSSVRTMETWFKFSSLPTSDTEIAAYGDNYGNGRRWGLWYSPGGTIFIETYYYSAYFSWTADTNWHHAVAELPVGCNTPSCAKFFFDGVQQSFLTQGGAGIVNTVPAELRLNGVPTMGAGWSFLGLMDEFRIANDAKTADWIATEYNNQFSPDTFAVLSDGSVESDTTVEPIIGSLSPNSGQVGTLLTISGLNFGSTQGTSTLTFNGAPTAPLSWSDNQITVNVPVTAVTGPVKVRVNNVDSNARTYYVPTPKVTALAPLGDRAGTQVTISGSAFQAQQRDSMVTFNGTPAAIVTWSDTQIIAIVPSGATSGSVRVLVNGIESNTNYVFNVVNPIVDRLEPASAAVNGTISIKGSGFGTANVNSSVRFNNIAAQVSSWTDTSISVTVPTGASSGTVTVALFNAVSNGAPFALLGAPSITSITPDNGPSGTDVTVSGTNFGPTQSTSTIAFSGVPADVTSWSNTQIIARVPAAATDGLVSVKIAGISAQGPQFRVKMLAQLTDSLGNVSTYTAWQFGGVRLVSDSTGPGCSSCTWRGVLHKTFDSNGNVLTATDEFGHTTTYEYDAVGNVKSVSATLDGQTVKTQYTYNSFGEVLTVTDPLGNVTTNTYDPKGNLQTVTSPAPDRSTAPSVTQFTYNSKGQLTQITDPLGHPTTMTYTAVGLVETITDAANNVTTHEYDSHGNRTAIVDATQHRTEFAYDSGDRLKTITYPDTTTSSFDYDNRGRRTSVTDQNGKRTAYTYDDADRLVSVTDAAQNVTTYGYDTESDLTSITDAKGRVTSFTYDTFGRVHQTAFPSSLTETYEYDAVGNLTSKTDRKGQSITYVYDALNRLKHKGYPDSTGVDYVYDLVGKVQQVNDPTGTYGFAYDNMGRLIGTTTQYAFLPGTTFSNSYTYDAASNRKSFTAPDGGTNTYVYDVLNRTTDQTNSWAGHFGFSYDTLNRRTQLAKPNGINTNYSYDSVSRLLSVLHQAGAVTIDGAGYTNDNAGIRTAKQNMLTGSSDSYTYDLIYQLTQVTQGGNATEGYTYDEVGNRLSDLTSTSWQYNSSNQLASTTFGTYTYDNNGNTLTKSDTSGTTQYAWDVENRLKSVTLPDNGGVVTFKYDPFGRRIQKSSATGATSVYVYDGANIVDEYDGAALLAKYAQGAGIDQPLAMNRQGSTVYYNADALGSITSLNDTTGAIVATYQYDAFGKSTGTTGTLANSFRYTGREWDQEIGLYYYRARYFDSSIGRFLSDDPVGFKGGPNFYRYVLNNPASLVDPSGEITQVAVGGPVWGNPWGHIAIIINGEVFSYGTNYTGGMAGVRDWGRSAADYLSTQSQLRQTTLLTLGISDEQEAKLLDQLRAGNPYNSPYSLLGHSCVSALLDPLRNAGILSTQPGPVIETPQGTLQGGAPAANSPNGFVNMIRSQNLVTSTTVVGSPSIDVFVRAVYGVVNGITPE